MNTIPDISFDQHLQELLKNQQRFIPDLTVDMLIFCNDEGVVQINETAKRDKKKLMTVKDFEVFFAALCVEGREWVNLAGDTWYHDSFIVSVEYSSRTGFPRTSILYSGPTFDGINKKFSITQNSIVEYSNRFMEKVIEKYSNRLPVSYLEFVSENQEFEGYLGDEFGYVVLWDIQTLRQIFHPICEYHDNIGKDYFPIGSDGGGENICIKLTSPTKELFFIEAISISDEYARFFCESFDKLYDVINQHLLKR